MVVATISEPNFGQGLGQGSRTGYRAGNRTIFFKSKGFEYVQFMKNLFSSGKNGSNIGFFFRRASGWPSGHCLGRGFRKDIGGRFGGVGYTM